MIETYSSWSYVHPDDTVGDEKRLGWRLSVSYVR